VRGGYRLARAAEQITFLDVVDAVEGDKPLFDCQEVRGRCALFGGNPPPWATSGTCAVHAVMIQAEKAMRDVLAAQTLSEVSQRFNRKAPDSFAADLQGWFGDRHDQRTARTGRPRREGPS
jgi:DNA-binding IscR family transcriptional regulator